MAEFYVVGTEKGMKAYYCGWWHTYREPLFAHHPSLAKKMSRRSANRVTKRLSDPAIWGGTWSLECTRTGC